MSVISSVTTVEGFVIGSDGRSRGPNGELQTDVAQKIFGIEHGEIRLAFGIFGTAKIGTDESNIIFDFEKAIPSIALAIGPRRNWWECLSTLAEEAVGSLNAARAGRVSELDPDRGTTISLGGFYGRFQKLGHISFTHGAERSDAIAKVYPPGFSFPWGSIKLFDLLNAREPMFGEYFDPPRVGLRALQDGIERVRKDILLHYDQRLRCLAGPGLCDGIGGRVQIATVDFADGFKWVPGFEPSQS